MEGKEGYPRMGKINEVHLLDYFPNIDGRRVPIHNQRTRGSMPMQPGWPGRAKPSNRRRAEWTTCPEAGRTLMSHE